ncbi:hypothetical protein F5Y06DRAFT_268878 [Hypoxylon sp. FL0890]|nr:hypothetical protein F5Y06DRAFT_268878 [Hypoxylon sp. FL0890]
MEYRAKLGRRQPTNMDGPHFPADIDLTRLPTAYEEPSRQCEFIRPCLLDGGVVDDCYKSRFYARALEFYLLEDNPESSKSYRCLMENCPQRNFTNPREMLRHLKGCPFFSQGMFRCPACNNAEKFWTVSEKSCSWNRENTSQKVHRKLKAIIKSVTHHHSDSKPSPGLNPCQEWGQLLNQRTFNSPYLSGPQDLTCKTTLQELEDYRNPQELAPERELRELQGEYSFPIGEVHDGPTDITPVSSVDHSQRRCSPTNQDRHTEGIRSRFEVHGDPSNGNSIEHAFASWQRPKSTLLSDAPTGIYDSTTAIADEGDTAQSIAFLDNSPFICSEVPSSSSIQQLHPEPSEREFQCPMAGCDFKPMGKPENYRAYLRKHVFAHADQRHRCEQCDRVYTRADNLEFRRRKVHHALKAV